MIYPDDFIDKVICGDCLEVMKDIPDNSVDLVLTDPPYNYKQDFGVCKDSWTQEEYELFLNDIIKQCHCITKKEIVMFCGTGNLYRYPEPSMIMMWYKPNASHRAGRVIHNKFEPILVYSAQHNIFCDVITCMAKTKNLVHPTEKPISIISKLLNDFTKPNDIVLDPFLGSGTTAVACKQLNRHFIGIEINPDYCKIAKERLMGVPDSLFKEV